MTTVSPTLLKNCKGIIIDVRTAAEHKAEQATVSHKHIPLDQLDPKQLMADGTLRADDELYLLCQGGVRAAKAAEAFRAAGCTNVHVIEGGLNACRSYGLCVETGKGISLERQVRIAAGMFVLAGVVLGASLAPGWYALSGFVGAGLIFAGITNWCGMGLLLAKAPWNKAV